MIQRLLYLTFILDKKQNAELPILCRCSEFEVITRVIFLFPRKFLTSKSYKKKCKVSMAIIYF